MATKVEELLNKIRIKLRLTEKYDHLSHITTSRPARKTFSNRSNRFRRQAAELQRAADQAKEASR